MRRISTYLIFALVILGLQASAKAQDILVPAGTLIRCTLDEPNFSAASGNLGRVFFPGGAIWEDTWRRTRSPGISLVRATSSWNSTASVSRLRMSRFPVESSLPKDTK